MTEKGHAVFVKKQIRRTIRSLNGSVFIRDQCSACADRARVNVSRFFRIAST